MDSTVFKYNQHQQQPQHQQHYNSSNTIQNNNNQNSIFILNTATNNTLPNNRKLHYNDFNDNHNVELSSSWSNTNATSSVWSSASSTMCSPAAHAIQKLFNCSSNSSKLNQANYRGIESKSFKSKSELLKKKSKFWKYLEGETSENININNNNNNDHQQHTGIEDTQTKDNGKSRKPKSKYWSKSYDSENQNHQDLSELLEYSCSLCDNCRCMDCQITYFDCDNSDDSNSEYSFHMNAYEEDDDDCELGMELKICKENHNTTKQTVNAGNTQLDNKPDAIHKLDSKQLNSYDASHEQLKVNCEYEQCCQACLNAQVVDDKTDDFATTKRVR